MATQNLGALLIKAVSAGDAAAFFNLMKNASKTDLVNLPNQTNFQILKGLTEWTNMSGAKPHLVDAIAIALKELPQNNAIAGEVLATFARQENFLGVQTVLQNLSKTTAANIPTSIYNEVLLGVSQSIHSDAVMASLVRTITASGNVDGWHLGETLKTFLENGDTKAAKALIASLDRNEAKSISLTDYNESLGTIVHAEYSDSTKADLIASLFKAGRADGWYTGDALATLSKEGDVTALKTMLNLLDTNGIQSVSYNHFNQTLGNVLHLNIDTKTKIQLVDLVLDKGTTTASYNEEAVKYFANRKIYDGVEVVLDSLSKTEKENFSTATKLELKAQGILYGDETSDIIAGSNGNDVIFGLAGHDKLYGGSGNDKLFGGSGNDFLYGGSGNDTLQAGTKASGAAKDYVDGGLGTDTLLIDSLFKDTVVDFRTGPDLDLLIKTNFGQEISVKNIEYIVFYDARFSVDQLEQLAHQNPSDNVLA